MAETRFDVGEVLSQAVRQALPALAARPIGHAFDCRLPAALVLGDPVQLRCALQPMLLAAGQLLHAGVVICDAQGTLSRLRLKFTVAMAGTGEPVDRAAREQVLSRLGLDPGAPQAGRLQRASGRCPHTGAELRFASLDREGFVFKFQHVLPLVHEAQDAPPLPDAGEARAWVVDTDEVAAQVLSRRLQRLGWATWTFRSTAQALARLRQMPPMQARPALVIGTASPAVAADGLRQLRSLLPEGTRCVLAALEGSPALWTDASGVALETHALPFSPADLQRLTASRGDGARGGSGDTTPAPLLLAQRPRMLVVDDDEVNRLVGVGLAETLGFEARAVNDGVEAVAACLADAPDIVLMDLAMPGLDGVAATRQLRELQRRGAAKPFPILGASAQMSDEARTRCHEAGMDGCLDKPLFREALRAECQRLAVWGAHA